MAAAASMDIMYVVDIWVVCGSSVCGVWLFLWSKCGDWFYLWLWVKRKRFGRKRGRSSLYYFIR